MAAYQIYVDHKQGGDAPGTFCTMTKPHLRAVLEHLAGAARGAKQELHGTEVTVRFAGRILATCEVDQFGNFQAEVLESEVFDPAVAYSTTRWAMYGVNGVGELMRLNADVYRNEDDETNGPPIPAFDVRGSVNQLGGPGGDGAYSMHGDAMCRQEVIDRLNIVLAEGFGLQTGRGVQLPAYMTLHIGPAGSGDDLPI